MGPEHTLFLSGVRASVSPESLQAEAAKGLRHYTMSLANLSQSA